MPEHIARANAKLSAVRSAVEHIFAGQKHRMPVEKGHFDLKLDGHPFAYPKDGVSTMKAIVSDAGLRIFARA